MYYRSKKSLRLFALVLLLLHFSCGKNTRREKYSAVQRGLSEPSISEQHMLLSKVIFQIKANYVKEINEKDIIRAGMTYYAKHYAQDMSVKDEGAKFTVYCRGASGTYSNFFDPIVELSMIETAITPCMRPEAKAKFKYHSYAMASAILFALPIPGRFYTKSDVDFFTQTSRGKYASTGIEITNRGVDYFILNVIPGSSAARAGIQAGQMLLSVNGMPTAALTENQLATSLNGFSDSEVQIEIKLPGKPAQLHTLRREKLAIPIVDTRIDESKILHIRLRNFWSDTEVLLRRAIEQENKAFTRIIIDLRGCTGGTLKEVQGIADIFLKEGLIFETRGRKSEQTEKFFATPKAFNPEIPIAVVTDGGTTAGAEILAIALQSARRAKIYGTPTRGIGVVSGILMLEYGVAAKIPTQEMYRGDGVSLRDAPVRPDIQLSPEQDAIAVARNALLSK